ncbi:MAG TPA: Gfo/Idh/MocA family oxidoreductase [Armatimonadota bacterium]
MNDAPLKAAVVGVGWWGRTHVEAYWRSPETELVAVCGRTNRERTEAVARQYGARAYLDIGEMLEHERPDLVSVIAPDGGHYLPYKQVLQSGVNCLVEKPLALDLAEGKELAELARSSGAQCGINFNHRYTTPFQCLAKDIAEGRIGRQYHLLWRFTGGHYPEGLAQPLAHLLYMQCHGFNLLETYGGPIASLGGHASDPRGTGQLTSAVLSLRFASGAVGSFVASVDGDYNNPDIYRLEVMGEGGRGVVGDALGRYEFCARGASRAEVYTPTFFDDEGRQFTRTTDRHIAEFVRALRQDEPVPIPLQEGLRALELGLAAAKAIIESRVVEVGPASGQ